MRSTLLALCALPIAFACKSGRAPEPDNRDDRSGTAIAKAAEKPKEPAAEKPAPEKPKAAPPAEVSPPPADGDPAKGKFTIEDATQGLPKDGKLVAELDTDKGKLECELYADKAPITVANFVGLARGLRPWKDPKSGSWVKKPLYDGTPFHRIIKGFMIQGGDPNGNGSGGPGYEIVDEIWEGAKHDQRGILCMANRGKNTNGSQFFIMDGAANHLDGGYTVFGKCGPDSVIEAIASSDVSGDRAVNAPKVKKVTVKRKK